MATPPPLTQRKPSEIRDGLLRTLKNGLSARGVANPNIAPGSDYYVLATAIANELCVTEANAVVAADNSMPDTAVADELRRWLQLFGDDFRAAAGSTGFVINASSAATTITAGTQLVDANQQRFEVSQTALYASGDPVPVDAIDTGTATNHDAGDVLTWVTAPPYCDATVLVASGGLTGGIAAETNEPARDRLFAKLQNPPKSGNWQHVAELAEKPTPSVEKCFVHPALQGPATLHFAVTRAATTLATSGTKSANRDLDATVLANTVIPYVKGAYPEHADITGTTVTNVNTDVSIALSLPSSPQATPPGAGGGWLDGSPWPRNVNADAAFKCTVTGVTSTSVFTVDAPSAPTANYTRIAYLSPTDWTLRTAKVVAVSGTTGAYTITIDNPFTNIATGNFIWPACQNAQTYVEAILTAFAAMGPGEKTDSVTALVRGFRHPKPQLSWPYSLTAQQLRYLTDSGDEVLGASYLYRSTTTPAVPTTITDPPNILVPRNLGFYAAT